MKLSEAIKKANEHQDKVGSKHKGKIIEAIIPAPEDPELFIEYVEAFKRHMLYYKRDDINFTKLNTTVQAKNFEVFYLLKGSLHTNRVIRSVSTHKLLVKEPTE